MTKNPIVNALAAIAYIAIVASVMYFGERFFQAEDTFIMPIAFLSLFVLSAAFMAYAFFYRPLRSYLDGEKNEGVELFTRTLLAFAVMTVLVFAFIAFMSGASDKQLVGADRDEHGCIGSAGYSWCPEKQQCIRQWEEYCTSAEPKNAEFTCKDGKTISSVFYPSDDKRVDLSLSDGRKISVPRALSASGARYANGDETFVFWNKGDNAFITENGVETYSGCSLSN